MCDDVSSVVIVVAADVTVMDVRLMEWSGEKISVFKKKCKRQK